MSEHITILDLDRVRGDNYPFRFQIFQKDGVTPEVITGFTFTMTVDPEVDPVNATNNLFQLSGVITDGPNGKVEFRPTLLNMDLTPDTYFYDVQMIDDGPYTRTPVRGKLNIEQDITKI